MKDAYLAGGCFWCVTPIYKMYGVDKVVCGYSGGDEMIDFNVFRGSRDDFTKYANKRDPS